MSTGFIADIHLHPGAPDVAQLLTRYLNEAREFDVLWILGDLFDAWIGDDSPFGALSEPMEVLQALSVSGTSVHLMRGNRDFLLGKVFAERTGTTVHATDHVIIDLATGLPKNEHTPEQANLCLLMHGDTLCTDDVAYLKLRETLWGAPWRNDFLARSLEERTLIAQQMREGSKDAMKGKSTTILDVTGDAVCQALSKHGVNTVLHGHTHLPADHRPAAAGAAADSRRVVLGDWHADGAQVAACDRQGILQFMHYQT